MEDISSNLDNLLYPTRTRPVNEKILSLFGVQVKTGVFSETTCQNTGNSRSQARSELSTSQMNQDEELWKPEDWYPPLCPPETLKEELLRDEDFTEVDKAARATPDSVKKRFDELVNYLTSHLSSDLHKLRSIFVWMGAQNIGCPQDTNTCEDNHSPRYYLHNGCKNHVFIGKLFVKMCRCPRIPCILVKGMAKGASYTPGDVDIKARNTWAVVYVAGCWRFVFPHWAFVKASGHQTGNWMLVEDSGNSARTRFTANDGKLISDIDEFYFLTDPNVIKFICHPNDKEKQLLNESWTKEQFFASPHFYNTYYCSGWQLLNPSKCVIKTHLGCCFIDFFSPGGDSKLNYKLFCDESCSGNKFTKEIQTDRYVIMLSQTLQTRSLLVRLPETGIYKLELTGVHEGNTYKLLQFRIDCDYVPPETRPFPSYPKNGFGFGKAAAEAGLSEPSHSEGIVAVKHGEEFDIHFKVDENVDISPRLIHFCWKPDYLHDNVLVRREEANVTITVKLPTDDSAPEYSLEIDTIKNSQGPTEPCVNVQVLNYFLTCDKTMHSVIMDKTRQKHLQCYEDAYAAIVQDDARLLEKVAPRVKMVGLKDPILDENLQAKKSKYKRLRKEVIVAAEERNLDRLNRALKYCLVVHLQYRPEVEGAKDILFALCKEEVEKVFKNLKVQELHECLEKVACSWVGEAVQEQDWFKNAQEVCKKLDKLQESKRTIQSLTDEDLANVFKPPDHVVQVISATFVLLGERQAELNTWETVWTTLHQAYNGQLFTKLSSFDDSLLTREQVDLAAEMLLRCDRKSGDDTVTKNLHAWCLDRIEFYRLRGEVTLIQ